MTAVSEAPTPVAPKPTNKGATVAKWLSTTDHKVIGNLYLITSMVFFAVEPGPGTVPYGKSGRALAHAVQLPELPAEKTMLILSPWLPLTSLSKF